MILRYLSLPLAYSHTSALKHYVLELSQVQYITLPVLSCDLEMLATVVRKPCRMTAFSCSFSALDKQVSLCEACLPVLKDEWHRVQPEDNGVGDEVLTIYHCAE